MESWISANWWWVWGIVGGVAYIVYLIRGRAEGTSPLAAVFPIFDPAERARVWTPRTIILWCVGMLIALAGVAVLASENGISTHSVSIEGDAITMAGSMGFAMYGVLGKRVTGKYDTLTMTAFTHFAGALVVLPLAIREAWALYAAGHWQPPWQVWAALLYMAVFSSALAYVFYYWLLRYLEASQLSAFTYLLPVLATILGIGWLGEKGSWTQVLGAVMSLGGVYWIESGRAAVVKANTVP